MPCALGLFSIKTTKDIGTHIPILLFFQFFNALLGLQDRECLKYLECLKFKVLHTILTLSTPNFRHSKLSYPISHTIIHIGRNSTSSFRRIFSELLI